MTTATYNLQKQAITQAVNEQRPMSLLYVNGKGWRTVFMCWL